MVKKVMAVRGKKSKEEKVKKKLRERKNQVVVLDQENQQEINQLNNKHVRELFSMLEVQGLEYLCIHGLADCSITQIQKLKSHNTY